MVSAEGALSEIRPAAFIVVRVLPLRAGPAAGLAVLVALVLHKAVNFNLATDRGVDVFGQELAVQSAACPLLAVALRERASR